MICICCSIGSSASLTLRILDVSTPQPRSSDTCRKIKSSLQWTLRCRLSGRRGGRTASPSLAGLARRSCVCRACRAAAFSWAIWFSSAFLAKDDSINVPFFPTRDEKSCPETIASGVLKQSRKKMFTFVGAATERLAARWANWAAPSGGP